MLSLPIALLCLILSHALSTTASEPSPLQSSGASTNLICHTSDPAECYPAVFSPTKDFQIVHDDQSIPPGLHVRMNLATGLKEARLDVPEENGRNPGDVVVIDNMPVRHEEVQSLVTEDNTRGLLVQDQGLSYDPVMEHDDRIPFNQMTASDPNEPSVLDLASTILASSPTAEPLKYLEDLGTLTDLAHDLEWGLTLMQDKYFSKHMVYLIAPQSSSTNTRVRSAAALLLGTALQNNHEALKHLEVSLGDSDLDPVVVSLSSLEKFAHSQHIGREDIVCAKRVIFLISQLCHNEKQMQKFVDTKGLQLLLEIIKDERVMNIDEEGPKLSAKIKNLVDNHSETLMTIYGSQLIKDF